MVDERDSAVVYMVALFLCLLGCCVLFVHFIIPTIPKKTVRFSRCPFGVISFPCVVDVCCLFPKTKNTVRGLWVPSVDAIVDRSNWVFFFLYIYRRCVGGRFVMFSGSTSWVLPRGVGFFVFGRIDEVPCTDPLPLYVEFRILWPYG